MKFSEPTIINIEPDWFKQGYYVYIVQTNYKGKDYFYIGMTGDRVYTTARSPFYRMSGHFNLSKSSTENQIAKGLAKLVPEDKLQDELPKMKVKYFIYLLDEYNGKNHQNKVIKAEMVESWLIRKFQNNNMSIFNEKISRKYDSFIDEFAEPIFSDFTRRI